MALTRPRLMKPDPREFRVGVGDPGHGFRLVFRWQAEQRVADDNSGVITSHMGELGAARHVARREYAFIGRAQTRIDLDASR